MHSSITTMPTPIAFLLILTFFSSILTMLHLAPYLLNSPELLARERRENAMLTRSLPYSQQQQQQQQQKLLLQTEIGITSRPLLVVNTVPPTKTATLEMSKMSLIDTSFTRYSPRVNDGVREYAWYLFKNYSEDGYFRRKNLRDVKKEFTFVDYVPTHKKKMIGLSNLEIKKCLRNKRIYLFGTSHHRAMYWHILKRLKGSDILTIEETIIASNGMKILYGTDCDDPEELRKNKHMYQGFPSEKYPFLPNNSCFIAFRGCNVGGPVGVDKKVCGVPAHHRHFDEEYNITLHFQFKTYLESPIVDKIIQDDLQKEFWDMVFFSACEWGAAFNRKESTPHIEFSNRFLESFTQWYDGFIVASVDPGYSRTCRTFNEAVLDSDKKLKKGGILVFDKTPLLDVRSDQSMDEGHGNEGPIVSF
jgi:hypothetical protein